MPTGIEQGQKRNSGDLAADEEARKAAEEFDKDIRVDLPREDGPDRHPDSFRTPGFSRMRLDWRSGDRMVIKQAQAAVEGRVRANFRDAFEVMYEVYNLVRTPRLDEHGNPMVDQWGLTIWKQLPSGSFDEDWSRLTLKAKEQFLFSITTRMFAWEQRAADAWTEAMFAKGMWEESFSVGFDEPVTGTVDDRKAQGNIRAADERYFAIFLTAYSKKTEAIVRSLSLLGQRIKDSMA